MGWGFQTIGGLSSCRIMNQSPLDNKTFQWVIALVISCLLAFSGFIYNNLDQRIRALEISGSPPMRERLARLESDRDSLKQNIEEIKQAQREIVALLRQHMENNGIEKNRNR